MNLVSQAKSNKSSSRNTYSCIEVVTALFMKANGSKTEDIVRVVGHSKYSLQYKLGRWLKENDIASQQDIYAHFKQDYPGDTECLAQIEALIAERTGATPTPEVAPEAEATESDEELIAQLEEETA